MTVLRSPLFIPGNRPEMLEKALSLRPDAYVPDLEDAVAADQKERAREVTSSFLPRLAQIGLPVVPRVNSLDSGLLEEDLKAVVGPHIFGVSVGKIRSAAEVRRISGVMEGLEEQAGVKAGGIKLVLWLETAMAIVRAYEICAASPRIAAVAFGAEDFTNDMGIERTADDSEIVYPMSVVAVAARAAGVLALDTPYLSFRDDEGLRRNSLAAKKYGFGGKFAIHPAQIEVINKAFSPSEAEVEHARRVVAAWEEARCLGRGTTSLDGNMIDAPVVKRAQRVIEMAEPLSRSGR